MLLFLHTRIRVSNLDQSIRFYTENLGFRVKSGPNTSPAGNTIIHLEIPGNEHTLELTYSPNYEVKVPEDLMHIAIGVKDLIATCDELEKKGIEIWPDGWREKFEFERKIAFIDDPDGYEIEYLEREGG